MRTCTLCFSCLCLFCSSLIPPAALRSSVAYALAHPELVKEGSAATYGLIAQIPSDAIVDQFLVAYLDKVLQPTPGADHTNINSTQGQQ